MGEDGSAAKAALKELGFREDRFQKLQQQWTEADAGREEARLRALRAEIGRLGEIVFINDGSRDRSLALLLDCKDRFPGRVVVIDFNGNFGQHMAIMAGFAENQCLLT